MKRLLFGLAALPFLAGVSLAAQPVPLSDQQMDKVTAGFDFVEINVQNLGTTLVAADFPPLGGAFCGLDGRCFIAVEGTAFPGVPGPVAGIPFSTSGPVQSLQVFSVFGP
jgi:hypothetical protein